MNPHLISAPTLSFFNSSLLCFPRPDVTGTLSRKNKEWREDIRSELRKIGGEIQEISDQIRSDQIKSRTSSCCWFRKTEAAGNQRKPQFLLNIWQKSSTLVYSITLSLIYKRDLNTRKSSQTFIKCFHHYVKFTPFCYEITTRCSLQLNNEILIHQHLTKNNRRVPVMLWRYLQKKSKHFPIKFF